jgi:hypothetical protein
MSVMPSPSKSAGAGRLREPGPPKGIWRRVPDPERRMIQVVATGTGPPRVARGSTTATSVVPSPSKSPETGTTCSPTPVMVRVTSVGVPWLESRMSKVAASAASS